MGGSPYPAKKTLGHYVGNFARYNVPVFAQLRSRPYQQKRRASAASRRKLRAAESPAQRKGRAQRAKKPPAHPAHRQAQTRAAAGPRTRQGDGAANRSESAESGRQDEGPRETEHASTADPNPVRVPGAERAQWRAEHSAGSSGTDRADGDREPKRRGRGDTRSPAASKLSEEARRGHGRQDEGPRETEHASTADPNPVRVPGAERAQRRTEPRGRSGHRSSRRGPQVRSAKGGGIRAVQPRPMPKQQRQGRRAKATAAETRTRAAPTTENHCAGSKPGAGTITHNAAATGSRRAAGHGDATQANAQRAQRALPPGADKNASLSGEPQRRPASTAPHSRHNTTMEPRATGKRPRPPKTRKGDARAAGEGRVAALRGRDGGHPRHHKREDKRAVAIYCPVRSIPQEARGGPGAAAPVHR